MLKKINIIISISLISLTVSFNSGFFLLIPVLLFYLFKEFKNIYYTYIPALLITILLNFNYSFELILVLGIVTGIYFLTGLLTKKHKGFIKYQMLFVGSLIFVVNSLMYLIFNKSGNVFLYLLTTIISVLLYIYLDMFIKKTLYNATNKYSIIFLASMIILLSVIGALSKNIYTLNLGVVASAFYIMYLSRQYKNIFPPIVSLVMVLVGYGVFKIPEFIFIPILSGLYFIDNIFIMIPANLILLFGIFIPNTIYDKATLISLMGVTVLFEVASNYIVNKPKLEHEVTEHIYEKIQSATSTEILNFALFLDKFANSFKKPKEYTEEISTGIKEIVQNHCISCPKNKECFEKYKTNLYQIFKSILVRDYEYLDIYPEFNDYCHKLNSIKRTSKLCEKKVDDALDATSATNNVLIGQMNGFSNTIKKYVLDLNAKSELNFYDLMQIKKSLMDYGYDITYFEIAKQYVDDFLITIGIKNKQFDEVKRVIESISTSFIKEDLSVVLYKEQDNNIYINIIPKIKIDVTYGFGSLSAEEVDICGDNYLIKEMKNGRFISAISDGMGKGYRAFYESDTTLKLIEDIISLNINSDTALEILNTYYTLQDYLEEYATLDFLEINRYKKYATFYKMGATSSYIFKKNGRVDKIINKNLPFGIDEEVDMNMYNLDSGDLILMSSDGIFENILDSSDFESFINNIKNFPPQRIVYEILNYTLSHKIKAKDDMSIIALKIQTAS